MACVGGVGWEKGEGWAERAERDGAGGAGRGGDRSGVEWGRAERGGVGQSKVK